ncbi:MAG: hypothetical protein WEE36_07690 [Acidimicrobiia bacterium]
MAHTARIAGAVALLLVAACGGDATPSTSAPTTTPMTTPMTTPTTTTLATTTTMPPTTTTVVLNCQSYGEAMGATAQSLLYQTFDAGTAFERQQGDALADSLLKVSAEIARLIDEIGTLGTPLPGFEEAVGLMLQAMEMDEEGYAAASAAARAGDDAALDAAVATVDAGFLLLMDANVALSAAQACSPEG